MAVDVRGKLRVRDDVTDDVTWWRTLMFRRELWPGYSTYTIWQTLLGTTRKLGRDHAVLAELYSTQMSNRLTELVDDVQRIYKKVLSFFLLLSAVVCWADADTRTPFPSAWKDNWLLYVVVTNLRQGGCVCLRLFVGLSLCLSAVSLNNYWWISTRFLKE